MTKELSRMEKVMIYVIQTLNDMADMKILDGKAFNVNEEAFGQLKGFRPTEEEIRGFMDFLVSEGYIQYGDSKN